jgi:hypothetical protein
MQLSDILTEPYFRAGRGAREAARPDIASAACAARAKTPAAYLNASWT